MNNTVFNDNPGLFAFVTFELRPWFPAPVSPKGQVSCSFAALLRSIYGHERHHSHSSWGQKWTGVLILTLLVAFSCLVVGSMSHRLHVDVWKEFRVICLCFPFSNMFGGTIVNTFAHVHFRLRRVDVIFLSFWQGMPASLLSIMHKTRKWSTNPALNHRTTESRSCSFEAQGKSAKPASRLVAGSVT